SRALSRYSLFTSAPGVSPAVNHVVLSRRMVLKQSHDRSAMIGVCGIAWRKALAHAPSVRRAETAFLLKQNACWPE
ncbi:MAG TPA: hypothetical protein VMZ01_06400, partial [Aestuariivirga sp.]|nr:hypothetical protein [Aestuariivirga sp.]